MSDKPSLPSAAGQQQQQHQQQPLRPVATAAEPNDKEKKEFSKSHAGLTTVPVKVMVVAEIEVLDLSHNSIEMVPRGLFSDIPKLKTCDLSHNSMKALPDDIAALRELQSFMLQHNCLSALPLSMYSLTALKTLDVSYNKLAQLQHEIGNMEGLQVLNVSGNRLRNLPAEVGWLASLKQLSVVDNADLHIPTHVLQKGLRGVMSYLQVVGEQHVQVESHMAAFTSRVVELRAKHNLLLPGSVEDEEAVLLRIKLAQKLGVLSCSDCGLAQLPAQFCADDSAVAAVQVVDLAYNKLHSCPQNLLGCINNLLVLNLSYNRLVSWPAGLHMPGLVVLNLSFNKLQQLSADMGQHMPALQQLYLANNFLTELPDSFKELELRDLFVSENELQTVPKVLSECTALVKLSLAACQLSGPCAELAGMSQLRFLDVSFNKLTVLSGELSALDGLSILNLGYNALGSLPDVVSCMTCLRELNLDGTGISTLPPGLGELRALEGLQAEGCPLLPPYANMYGKDPLLLVALHDREQLSLDLSDCGLSEMPADLQQQTQLTSLNLGKNSITDLPTWLGNLRRLRQLTVKGNPLHQPYARLIDARGELAVLALLRPEGAGGTLDLSSCSFETLPAIVWELPGRASSLQELHLPNNRLWTLPEEMACLVSLTRLVLDNNMLRQLPDVVPKLPALAVLQASGNRITHLPDTLEKLQPLQALMVAENQLRQLPDSISSLTRLRALSLSCNRLWQLPAGTANLRSLKLLDCSHNQLGRLPQGLGELTNLRSLKLTHNRFSWLPVEDLRPMKHLEECHVAANSFAVEGFEGLNASGRLEVQALLAALQRSGHGVPPLMDGHSSIGEGSWNAGAASGGSAPGILHNNSDGGVSVGRGSVSSIIGGRSPSPLRGLQEGQQVLPPALAAGLLNSLRRIGSRSPSPCSRGQQEQGPNNVRWCDGVAPVSKPAGGIRWSDGVNPGSDAAVPPVAAASGKDAQAAAASRSEQVAGQQVHSSTAPAEGEPAGDAPGARIATIRFEEGAHAGTPEEQQAHSGVQHPQLAAGGAANPAHGAAARNHVRFSGDTEPEAPAPSACAPRAAADPAAVAVGAHIPERPPRGAAAIECVVHAAAGIDAAACSSPAAKQAPSSSTEPTTVKPCAAPKPSAAAKAPDSQAEQLAATTAANQPAVKQHTGKLAPAAGAALVPVVDERQQQQFSTAQQEAGAGVATAKGAASPAKTKAKAPPALPAKQPSPPNAASDAKPPACRQATAAGSTVAAQLPAAAPGQLAPKAPTSVDVIASKGAPSSSGSSSISALSALLSAAGEGSSPSTRFDSIPLMDIPRVVKACMHAPPPPPPPSASAALLAAARPQTSARFRRVLQQGASALALLEYGIREAGGQTQGCAPGHTLG